MSSSLRLFVAIYPGPEAAARMLMGGEHALPADAHRRAVAPAQVHMTVQFIGDTEERELPAVCESVRRSAAGVGAFSLEVVRLATLPERGRPRLLAAITNSPPPLLELHRRLASRLARHPRARPGDRFLPHLTLCRFTGRAPRVDAPWNSRAFDVRAVRLMASVLRSTGAEHTEVLAVALEGRA